MNTDYLDSLIVKCIKLLKQYNKTICANSSDIGRQLLNIIIELANNFITCKEGELLCRYQYLLLWREYTIHLEGDLLVAAFLASNQKDVSLSHYQKNFDWKLVVDHDNKELNSIFRKGMAENHYHLGGSLPIFQCTWIDMMNESYNSDNINKFFGEKKYLLSRAIQIRKYLLNTVLLKKDNFLMPKSNTGIKSYYEERAYLYGIICECIQSTSENQLIEQLFYEYLKIKEYFRNLVVQCKDNIGESCFFSISQYKSKFLKLFYNMNDIIKTSIEEQIQSNYIKKLEIRIKMQNSPYKLYQYIRWLNMQLNFMKVEIRYIICFSRNKIVSNDFLQYRDQLKYYEVYEQHKNLNQFLQSYKEMAKKVVGIDVCSKESDYKPQIFSNIMLRKKNGNYNTWKRMYHVGEEFLDILSGLRAIDECIVFYKLRAGDRLGHAIPIFENIREWYSNHKNQVAISKEEYLDNLVWLYCNLFKHDIEHESDIEKKILTDFQFYFCDLYKNIFENTLNMFNENLGKRFDCYSVSIFHCFQAWKLRREKPEKIKNILKKTTCNNDRIIPYFITYCYFYSPEVRDRGSEMINIHVSDQMLYLIQTIQNIIQHKIEKRKICVEICPSSNVLLDNVSKEYYHPLIDYMKKQNKPEICFSINTDNQGIFSTSLTNEYSLFVSAFESEIEPMQLSVKKRSVYEYIDKVRKNGIKMCSL